MFVFAGTRTAYSVQSAPLSSSAVPATCHSSSAFPGASAATGILPAASSAAYDLTAASSAAYDLTAASAATGILPASSAASTASGLSSAVSASCVPPCLHGMAPLSSSTADRIPSHFPAGHDHAPSPTPKSPFSSLPASPAGFLHPCVPSTCHQTTPLPVLCPRLSASLSGPNLIVFSNLPTSHSPKALYLFCASTRYPTPSLLPLWRVHSSGYCHPGASVFSLGRMRKSIIFPTLFHGCFSCRLPSRIGHNE